MLRHEKSGTLLIPKEAEKPVVYRPFQQHEPLPKHKMESLVDYVSAGEIAVVWGVSEKRVQNLIKEGRVPLVVRINGCKVVFIPKGTPKPQVRSYAQKRTTSQ